MPLLSQQSQTLLEEGETEVAKDDVASIIWVLAVVLAAIEVVGGVAAIVIVAAVLAAIEVVGGVAAIVKVAAVLAATEVAGGVAAIVIVAAVVVVEVLAAAAAAAAVEGAATTRGGREERTQGETMEEHDTKAEDEDNGKAWKVESKGRGGIDPPLFKAVSFRVTLSDSSRFTRFSRLSREEVSV